MAQDRSFQFPESRTRLETELVSERAPRVPIDLQGVDLSVAAIKRDHQLRAGTLAEWVLCDEHPQLSHDLSVATEREVGLEALLECGCSELLEPVELAGIEHVMRHALEGPSRQSESATRSVAAAAAASPCATARRPSSTSLSKR